MEITKEMLEKAVECANKDQRELVKRVDKLGRIDNFYEVKEGSNLDKIINLKQ